MLVSKKMALKTGFLQNTLYKIFRKNNSRVKGRDVGAILGINQTDCFVVQNHINTHILQLDTFKNIERHGYTYKMCKLFNVENENLQKY